MKVNKKIFKSSIIQRNQKGIIIVFIALCLPILLGFTMLSFDVSRAYAFKEKIESAADFAAVAGTSQLVDQSSVSSAKTTALNYLNSNLTSTLPSFSALTLSSTGLTIQAGIYDFTTSTFTWDETSSSVNAVRVLYSYTFTPFLASYFMLSDTTITGESIAAKYYAGSAVAMTTFPIAINKSALASGASLMLYQSGGSTNSYFTSFGNTASASEIRDKIRYFENLGSDYPPAVSIGDEYKYNNGAIDKAWLYINLLFPWTLPGDTFVFPIVTESTGTRVVTEGFIGATITGFGIGGMGYYTNITITPRYIANSWGGLQIGEEPSNISSSDKPLLATAIKIVK